MNSQQPAAEDGGASLATRATSDGILKPESPAHADPAARSSPPNGEETRTSALLRAVAVTRTFASM
jgi:hypothetical protein